MIIHWLQHVPFEGLGAIEGWAYNEGLTLRRVALHAGDAVPAADEVDALIVMGGPMGVHDALPWMADELRLIGGILAAGRPCLGICLGAQLMAHALGAAVQRGPAPETGWIPLRAAADDPLALDGCCAFHWHGDAFALPAGATRLASTPACPNQIARFGRHALALQCHLEIQPAGIRTLCQACGDDHRSSGAWVQSQASMLARAEARCEALAPLLDRILACCFRPAEG